MVVDDLDQIRARAQECGEDVTACLDLASSVGATLPLPGHGTAARWDVLAAVAAENLTAARVLEAHADALAILAEAGERVPDGTWGVFAAEAPGVRLEALPGPDGHGLRLSGTKPWCSLAAHLDAALVTAHTPEGRQLFRVDLRGPGVQVAEPEGWAARGLRTVVSVPVHFDAAPATPVGPPGWYLVRPGFAWGGIGVAACWYGGASGLLPALHRRVEGRDGDLDALHLGAVDAALHGAGAVLDEAADLVDRGAAHHAAGELLALRVRAVVADAVERTLQHAAHALGPAPLAFDAAHAARVADLGLYVRQHHAERDLATLGRMVVTAGGGGG